MQRRLLTSAAVIELLTGLALIVFPGFTVTLIFGVEPDSLAIEIARVGGAALLALGISCWGARDDPGGGARSGTLRAITVYNGGAGLILLGIAVTGKATGMVIWVVALIHLAHAVLFAFSLARPGVRLDGEP